MFIYLITNKINGKRYVGQTIRNVEKRFKEHCSSNIIAIDKAIQKYGKENFTVETLQKCTTIEQLNDAEKFWIKKLNSLCPQGYNISEGGYNSIKRHNDKEKTNIGVFLKRFRKENNLSQAQIAEKIGTTQQAIYSYEMNKVIPNLALLEKIANAYDVSADYLLGRSDNPKNHKITPAEIKLLESVKNFLSEKNL